jgi:hypothetical protein
MSEAKEVKIKAKLIFENKEIETIEKCIGIVEEKEEGSEENSKSLDEIVLEFLKEIEDKAKEQGYSIPENSLSEIAVATIFFLIKQPSEELELSIELRKDESNANDA